MYEDHVLPIVFSENGELRTTESIKNRKFIESVNFVHYYQYLNITSLPIFELYD